MDVAYRECPWEVQTQGRYSVKAFSQPLCPKVQRTLNDSSSAMWRLAVRIFLGKVAQIIDKYLSRK